MSKTEKLIENKVRYDNDNITVYDMYMNTYSVRDVLRTISFDDDIKFSDEIDVQIQRTTTLDKNRTKFNVTIIVNKEA